MFLTLDQQTAILDGRAVEVIHKDYTKAFDLFQLNKLIASLICDEGGSVLYIFDNTIRQAPNRTANPQTTE